MRRSEGSPRGLELPSRCVSLPADCLGVDPEEPQPLPPELDRGYRNFTLKFHK